MEPQDSAARPLETHDRGRVFPGPESHICLIYDNETERREVVAEFIRAGLSAGERVAYFTDADPDALRLWLGEHGVELPPAPQYTAHVARDVYCPDGEFKVDRMFDYWRQFHRDSQAQGFPGARATGETTWSREVSGGEGIVEYECRLNDLLAEIPVAALCQYDVRRFDGATILDILRVHPVMLFEGQLVRNPFYMRPEEFLAFKRCRTSD